MKITTLYSRRTITIERADSLVRAAELMAEHNVGVLPVLEGGRLCGMVSERDMVHAIACGVSPATPVAECMTRGVAWIPVDSDSSEAAHKMLVLGVRHLPVVDHGKMVGMLSARDLLAVAAWPERVPAAR